MSYSGNPANNTRDAARFHVGDTDTSKELLADAEYDWLLSESSDDPRLAAAAACDALATRFAQKVDTTVGRASKSLSQRSEAYAKRARLLRVEASKLWGTVRAGGISQSDKEAVASDPDRVKPAFRRDMHRNLSDPDATGRSE